MAYSTRLRTAIGAVRAALLQEHIGLQDPVFAEHGEHDPLPDAPLILVACSGGRDSMALSAVSQVVCASLGVRCGAVIVDHRLQQSSQQIAQQAAERCRELGLSPVETVSVHVEDTGQGIEAAARDARYQAITQCAIRLGASAVLLAHTRDDQAETILMSLLLRSGGLNALAGMPRRSAIQGIPYIRPLLDMSRKDTTGICEDLGLIWWDDPTNGDGMDPDIPLDRAFPLRSRIRHTIMPYLSDFIGNDVAARLSAGARYARQDMEYLDAQADILLSRAIIRREVHQSHGIELDIRPLREATAALRSRAIARALTRLGIEVSLTHVEAVDALIMNWHGQGALSLPGGYSARRRRHVIRVCQDGGHANR
jgi:tRNA(Ile)-lysidine synthase